MAKSPAKSNAKKSVGRYVDAESRGRITKRRPPGTEHSPRWYGWLILELLIAGMLVIVLNYLDVLPGATSSWYLALGLVAMFAGFYMATRYK